MKKLFVLTLIALCVAMAATNPGPDAHRKVVSASIASAKANNELVGKIAGDLLADTNVVPISYNSYYLFSTTTLNGNTASVGLCSRVWSMEESPVKTMAVSPHDH